MSVELQNKNWRKAKGTRVGEKYGLRYSPAKLSIAHYVLKNPSLHGRKQI